MCLVLALLAAGSPGSIRAVVAAGGGDIGVAGYLSLQGERWVTENFALGARASYGGQGSLGLFGRSRSAAIAGVDVLAGLPHPTGRLVAGAGVALASVEDHPASGLCFFGPCPPAPASVRSEPVIASVVVGIIAAQGHLAASALARLQSMGSGWEMVGEVGVGFAF